MLIVLPVVNAALLEDLCQLVEVSQRLGDRVVLGGVINAHLCLGVGQGGLRWASMSNTGLVIVS